MSGVTQRDRIGVLEDVVACTRREIDVLRRHQATHAGQLRDLGGRLHTVEDSFDFTVGADITDMKRRLERLERGDMVQVDRPGGGKMLVPRLP